MSHSFENGMKKIKFKPGDTNYRSRIESESPFAKRGQVVFAHDNKTKAKILTVKNRYYELFFSNEKESYLSRDQYFNPQEMSNSSDTSYSDENRLIGNDRQINFSISKLLKHILIRLADDPQNLFLEADTIRQVCQEEELSIPSFEAFDKIKSWEEFMALLNSISETDNIFKFELLLAAIIQYATLCTSK